MTIMTLLISFLLFVTFSCPSIPFIVSFMISKCCAPLENFFISGVSINACLFYHIVAWCDHFVQGHFRCVRSRPVKFWCDPNSRDFFEFWTRNFDSKPEITRTRKTRKNGVRRVQVDPTGQQLKFHVRSARLGLEGWDINIWGIGLDEVGVRRWHIVIIPIN